MANKAPSDCLYHIAKFIQYTLTPLAPQTNLTNEIKPAIIIERLKRHFSHFPHDLEVANVVSFSYHMNHPSSREKNCP